MVHQERRAYPRHEVQLPAHLSLRIGDESNVIIRIPGTVCSISRNGARLDVPSWAMPYFRPGKTAVLRIKHPELSGTELRCRVVWFNETQLAVEFAGRLRFTHFDAAPSWFASKPPLAGVSGAVKASHAVTAP